MGWLEQPMRWLRNKGSGLVVAGREGTRVTDAVPPVYLDFPACVAREYTEWFPIAWQAIDDILAVIRGVDFTPLERRSPALKGYAWDGYLRCSAIRMVRAARALHTKEAGTRCLLDYGSYFGNFALMFARLGYEVHAADSYREYGQALAPVAALLKENGVTVYDTTPLLDERGDLFMDRYGLYDVVLSVGVIEHIPHTPRLYLETLDRLLKPSGTLVLDTPNLAYLYTRQKLARGETMFCPIERQYETQLPFEGHHREYTVEEMRWMLERLGHENIWIDTFNYSIYGAEVLSGQDAMNFRQMASDPSTREVILTVSRKAPVAASAAGRSDRGIAAP